MAYYKRQDKPEKKHIGQIGQFEVVQYGETPMLIVGKKWISVDKAEVVLENEEAFREFIDKYKPKPEQSAAATGTQQWVVTPTGNKITLEQYTLLVQAQAQKQLAQQQHPKRVDPIS